jgi:hypothetical protein
MGSGKHLTRARKKYGDQSFTKEILFTFATEAEMNTKERELVTSDFCARKDTYNICEGGKGGFGFINQNITTAERRKRMAVTRERYWSNFSHDEMKTFMREVTRKSLLSGKKYHAKISEKMLRCSQSQEARNKRKDTFQRNNHAQGQKNSQFGTIWVTNGIDTKKIKNQSLEEWIVKGYRKGRAL